MLCFVFMLVSIPPSTPNVVSTTSSSTLLPRSFNINSFNSGEIGGLDTPVLLEMQHTEVIFGNFIEN